MATIKKGLAISGVLIVALLMIKYLMKDVPPSPFALEISEFLKTNSKSIGSFALVIFLLLILIGLKDWDMNLAIKDVLWGGSVYFMSAYFGSMLTDLYL